MQAVWSALSSNQAFVLIAVVLGLLLLFIAGAWLFRKIAGGNTLKTTRGRQPRLSVTDAAIVDDKRRLVLVRRDNIEHLVMIGGPTDIVIEQNIVRAQTAAPAQREPAAVQHREPAAEQVVEPQAPVQRLRQPVQRVRTEQPPMEATPPARSVEQAPLRTSTAAAAAVAATVAAVEFAEPQAITAVDEPYLAQVFQAEEITAPEPEPVIEAIADFESDLAAEMARDFSVQAEPEPVMQAPAEPSLEGALNEELSEDLDFAKLLGSNGTEVPAMVTPEPTASPSRKRQESVDDEMQRLLDELASA